MLVRRFVFSAIILLGITWQCEAQNTQNGEQILAADKAPVGAPLRRPENFPWYQLSNLRKGGGQLRPAEFTLDYTRQTDSGGHTLVLVANGANGRKEYSTWGPFSPFADKSGTVSAEASFSPFAKNLGDNFEIWLEARLQFEGKPYNFKVSNSVVLGNVGQPTLARHWSAEEQKGVERWVKSTTPPSAPAAGHIAVAADTKLVPGMPIKAGWIGAWEPAEVIDVRKDGMVLVKYKPELTAMLILRARNWLAVESSVLQTAQSNPTKFQPSVRVLPGDTVPLNDDLTLVDKDTPLVPGTPVQMSWGNKWEPVTVIKALANGRVRVRWDGWKNWPEEEKTRDLMVMTKETLKALKEPDAAEKFAERMKAETSFGGQTAERARKLQDYPIKIAIPASAVKVTDDTPLAEGTKLGCSWGASWYDVTVTELNDDGTVRIHWDKFGDAWDGDISRECLIIDKRVLSKLPKKPAKEPAKTTAKTSKKPATKSEEPDEPAKPAGDGEFQLVLNGFGKNKFAVIKIVMEITGLEIKDAKELVENLPIPIKQGLDKKEADKLKKKLTDAGGTAEVKAE